MTNRRKTISRPRFKISPSPSYSAEISRINELSKTSRTVWLSLLGYLAFVGITLLGVDDADFFVPSRQTQLPLINVAIPTASFFLFSPILGAALYVYLHLYLVKFWEALSAPPSKVNGLYLSDVLLPWLIVDFGLWMRRDGALRKRTLRWMSLVVTFLLVFVAGPLVIGATWWRYWPAHDLRGALLIGLCFWIALDACFKSGIYAWVHLRGGDVAWPWLRRCVGWGISVCCALVLAFATAMKTEGLSWEVDEDGEPRAFAWRDTALPVAMNGLWRLNFTGDENDSGIQHRGALALQQADLTEKELVVRPAGMLDYASARRVYRGVFCKSRGVAADVCGMSPQDQSEPPINQAAARSNWAKPYGLNVAEIETYFNDLETSFQSAWFAEHKLQMSSLQNLSLRGRDLRNAQGAQLFLNGADLREVNLQGAYLQSAEMQGVNLEDAQLHGADLEEAQLQGADLEDAQLQGADLTEVNLQGADLEDVNFLDAKLQNAVLQGANLRGAMLQGVNLWNADLGGANLQAAELQRVDLRFANLESAEMSFVKLQGADLTHANLKNTHWLGAPFGAILAHNADFRGTTDLTQPMLKGVIGNEGTLLYSDEGLTLNVWSCWEPENVPDNFEALVEESQSSRSAYAVRKQWLCSEDNPRRAVGTTLHPDAPYPDGHPLAFR